MNYKDQPPPEAGEQIRPRGAELSSTWAQNSDLYDLAPIGYCSLSENGLILHANLATATLLGVARDTLAEQPITRFILEKDRALFNEQHKQLSLTGKPQTCELSMVRTDGSQFWAHLAGIAVQNADDARICRLMLSDITDRKLAEAALHDSEQYLRAVVETTLDAVITMDSDGRITAWNQQAEKVFGWLPQEAVGQTVSQLIVPPQHREAHDRGLKRFLSEGVGPVLNQRIEITALRKSGEEFPVELAITPVRVGKAVLFSAFMRDITERKTAAEKIESLAFSLTFYDPLTELPNRRLLMDRLAIALAACVRHRRRGALLSVDLDNFKTINDTHGHQKGDLLLQQVAKRLLGCIRESETVARLGSDKFVVMLENLSESPLEAAGQIEIVGERILSSLSQTYQLDDFEHHCTLSIGITLFGEQQESIEEPLKRADLAMHQAKAAGRNGLRFFDPQMQAAAMARSTLEADLHVALAKSQLVLYYQAQVLGERQLTGAEVLVRWNHPRRGMVLPSEFIPLAEDTGLILPLGEWVLETACTQLATWADRTEMAHLTIAVNVSPRQFHQVNFVEQVLAALERTGANPQRLKLELTEGVLVSNVDDIVAKMSALKQLGVGFSLDDFGTGYSSLSYLKKLPLDQLKIDQSFVRDILTDGNDAAIAQTVIALAHGLGLAVIAEGVETEAQRVFLCNHGCDAYQGYLLSRPLPVEDFEKFVATCMWPTEYR